jgi:hypothetical protein
MNNLELLQQENDQLKVRLADIVFYAKGIIRDSNERDKVFIQAEDIITVCGNVGEIRSQYLVTELKRLKRQISEQSDIINSYRNNCEVE